MSRPYARFIVMRPRRECTATVPDLDLTSPPASIGARAIGSSSSASLSLSCLATANSWRLAQTAARLLLAIAARWRQAVTARQRSAGRGEPRELKLQRVDLCQVAAGGGGGAAPAAAAGEPPGG